MMQNNNILLNMDVSWMKNDSSFTSKSTEYWNLLQVSDSFPQHDFSLKTMSIDTTATIYPC